MSVPSFSIFNLRITSFCHIPTFIAHSPFLSNVKRWKSSHVGLFGAVASQLWLSLTNSENRPLLQVLQRWFACKVPGCHLNGKSSSAAGLCSKIARKRSLSIGGKPLSILTNPKLICSSLPGPYSLSCATSPLSKINLVAFVLSFLNPVWL